MIAEHLAAARAFRDDTGKPLDIFLIDDGFTPEMGDWLDVKPQFPRGMEPLLADIRDAGFVARACGSRRSWSATARGSSPSIPTGW